MISSTNIHACKKIIFKRHMPAISNAVTFVIETDEGHFDLTLFDLPQDEVAKIYAGFEKPEQPCEEVNSIITPPIAQAAE